MSYYRTTYRRGDKKFVVLALRFCLLPVPKNLMWYFLAVSSLGRFFSSAAGLCSWELRARGPRLRGRSEGLDLVEPLKYYCIAPWRANLTREGFSRACGLWKLLMCH